MIKDKIIYIYNIDSQEFRFKISRFKKHYARNNFYRQKINIIFNQYVMNKLR